MAIEDDLLKTLLRIEKLLGNSSSGAGSRERPTLAGGRIAVNRAGGSTANDKRTDAQGRKTFQATSVALDTLADTADTLTSRFTGLSKTVLNTRSNFVAMNRSMRAAARNTPTANVTGSNQQVAQGANASPMSALLGQFGGRNNPLMRTFNALNGSVSVLGLTLTGVAASLSAAIKPLINDFFAMHEAGLGGATTLGTLYMNAARAGMSLQEYTKLLQDSIPAVTRAASLDDFNKTLSTSNNRLAGLGIFGAKASELSAQLATNTAIIGVSQSQLDSSIAQQTSIFASLSKVSLMTADGFKELTASLANNQDVQLELAGLNQNQRQARFNEIVQTNLIGQRMGMTAKASEALGAALTAQRKMTAVERFGAAGRIRQAGAITGMSSADTERLARLQMNNRRTDAQDAEYAGLGGQLISNLERMQNSGNIGQQNIADQISATPEFAKISEALKLSAQGKLAQESGPAGVNKNFARGTDMLSQAAGQLLAYAQGLSKNPIVDAITGALGSAAFGGALAFAFGRSLGKLGIMGRGAGMVAGVGSGIKSAAGGVMGAVKGGAGRVMGALSTPINFISNGASKLWDGVMAMKGLAGKIGTGLLDFSGTLQKGVYKVADIVATVGNFFKTTFGRVVGIFGTVADQGKAIFATVSQFVESSGGLLKVLSKGAGIFRRILGSIPVIGNIISFFIDGIGEVFTGNIAAAFNSNGGGWLERIGGVVFAAINGIFGGIFGLVDSAIKLFGGDGFNLENAWERFSVTMKAGLMLSLAAIVKAIPVVGDRAAAYFEKSAEDSFAVLQELSENEKATISSIGEKRNAELDKQKVAAKKAEESSKSATKAVDAAAGILTSTKGVTGQLMNRAATIAAPGQTPRTGVTPPEINNAEPVAAAAAAVAAVASAQAAPGTVDWPTTFATIIGLLQQSLDAERAQNASMEQLLRASGQPIFGNTSTSFEAVTRLS